MKSQLSTFIFLICNTLFCQNPSDYLAKNNTPLNTEIFTIYNAIDANGFSFKLLDAGVNSKYSEFGSGFFRNKLLMVSSKKLGGLARIDRNTNEAYKDIFCLDINPNGSLSLPLLFSRILNTNASEDQLTFSPDQKTVYFTRSSKKKSLEYKLYKATLEENSHGNWMNIELLSINKENTSIETPFINSKGDKLYFSSNMPGTIGGFDLFVSNINPDGTLETPKNLGSTINTISDEKYPSLSNNSKYFYFSSKGHKNIGGYDVFISRLLKKGYKSPRNLGNTINSSYDEVAFFLAAKNKGYVSSNRPNGKGGFDIYTARNKEIIQNIEGKILDLETKIELPNTLVVLFDEDGNEISRQVTDENATYNFSVVPFEVYTITAYKDGFIDGSFEFLSTKNIETTYHKSLNLNTTEPLIAKVNEKLMIVIENIHFDTAKWSIKKESLIALNKIIKVLNKNPKMNLTINAHTDSEGNATYNLDLSDKRAAAALKYLINNGISKNRLTSKGFGETQLLIDCKSCTEKEQESNRRIEFIILN